MCVCVFLREKKVKLEQVNALPAMMTKGIWKIAKAAKYRRAKENFNVFKPRLCLGLFKSNFIYFGFFFFSKEYLY